MRKRESEKERGKEEERQQHWVRDEHSRRAVSDVENFLSSGNCIPLAPPLPLPMSLPLPLPPTLPLLLLLSLSTTIPFPFRTARLALRQLTLSPLSFVTASCLTYHVPAPFPLATSPPLFHCTLFCCSSPLVVRCSRLINFCAVACPSLNPCALWCHVRNCTYHFCHLPTSLSLCLSPSPLVLWPAAVSHAIINPHTSQP